MIKYFGATCLRKLEGAISDYARDKQLKVVSIAITGDSYKEALVVFTVRF